MKTYFSDLIPRIKKFSKKLDDLTLLTDQHWVVIDEIENYKNVYIFKKDYSLLLANKGKVRKGNWEYLGNNFLLIDQGTESFLFKLGFFDENILALKIDGKDEYVFLINENRYNGELNSIDKVVDFLNKKYIEPDLIDTIEKTSDFLIENKKNKKPEFVFRILDTNKGVLKIKTRMSSGYTKGDEVFLNDKLAPDGMYADGWPSWLYNITIENGKIK